MPALALLYWKELLAAGVVVALAIYIFALRTEVQHLTAKYEKEHKAFVSYKATAEQKQRDLSAAAADLTERFAERTKEYILAIDQNFAYHKELLSKDEELNRIRVSNRALRLLNQSTTQPGIKVPPEALQGDAPKAGGSEASTPLSVVFTVVAENNANHLKCVKQVEDWQDFWKNYVTIVEGVNKNASSP